MDPTSGDDLLSRAVDRASPVAARPTADPVPRTPLSQQPIAPEVLASEVGHAVYGGAKPEPGSTHSIIARTGAATQNWADNLVGDDGELQTTADKRATRLGDHLHGVVNDVADRIDQGAAAALGGATGPATGPSKALGSVTFGGDPNAPRKYKQTAADLFKARSDEIAAAMSDPATTQGQVRKSLQGVGAVDAELAGQMANVAMQRLQYLAQVMPKNPGIGTATDGFSKWQPSDAEVSSFARTVAATMDPMRILDELKANRLTPETVAAVKATAPQTFAQIQTAIASKLSDGKELPYAKRQQLGLIFDKPVDSSQRPEFVAAMQQNFAQVATPQQKRPALSALGKQAKPEPTPGQRLAS